MKRKIVSTMTRVMILTIVVGISSLAIYSSAEASHRRAGIVVRHRVHRTVRGVPRPVVVRYVPSSHRDCRMRNGYYYSPAFGYHLHRRHPGGIYFGVNLVL